MSDITVPDRQRSLPENPAEISMLSGILSENQNRVAVMVELTNGVTHPDLELALYDADHSSLSKSLILENIGPQLAFTMHIRQKTVKFPLTIHCALSYVDDQISSEKEVVVENK
jgi:hypothetical protein